MAPTEGKAIRTGLGDVVVIVPVRIMDGADATTGAWEGSRLPVHTKSWSNFSAMFTRTFGD